MLYKITYIVAHYPYAMLHRQGIANHPDVPASTHVFISVCVPVLPMMTACATYRLCDLPVGDGCARACSVGPAAKPECA